jgi:programmed cell death protein 5
MGADEDIELEQLKQKRMMDMRKQVVADEEKAKVEDAKQAALRIILEPEARQRLANIRMIKPEFAEQLEVQLIQLAQTGRVKVPITDLQLKQLLVQLTPKKREFNIRRI